MSIRTRLIAMCLFISLLPAIPVSLFVRGLLEKSIDVGLSEDISEALGSGIEVSRKYLSIVRSQFESDVSNIIVAADAQKQDSSKIAVMVAESRGIDGFFIVHSPAPLSGLETDDRLLEKLSTCLSENAMAVKRDSLVLEPRTPITEGLRDAKLYETRNHDIHIALWRTPGNELIVFFKKTGTDFLAHANKIINGKQTFAQLRLSQEWLSQSFFYPFIVIYGVILLISMLTAFFLAERLAAPIKKLEKATSAVASGNWEVRIKERAGGEIGRLIEGFNRMTRKLKEQNRKLIDMEKMMAWREVARHLAHEIKNPLLPIRLTIQEIRDQYRGEDKNYRELLDESVRLVEEELESLQNLVKEFSLLAKMPELSPVKGSMEKLARDVVNLYPQVDATIEAAPSLRDFPFDHDKMRQVLVNLIGNSLAVAPGDKKVEIKIDLSVSPDDEFVMVYTDNGPGIPGDIINRVFDPYFTTRKEGSGLGLAIVKNIVMLHGGDVEAGNAEGGYGARFRITIPLNPDAGHKSGRMPGANDDGAEENGVPGENTQENDGGNMKENLT